MDCLGIYKILEENIHDDTGEEVEGKEYKKVNKIEKKL